MRRQARSTTYGVPSRRVALDPHPEDYKRRGAKRRALAKPPGGIGCTPDKVEERLRNAKPHGRAWKALPPADRPHEVGKRMRLILREVRDRFRRKASLGGRDDGGYVVDVDGLHEAMRQHLGKDARQGGGAPQVSRAPGLAAG